MAKLNFLLILCLFIISPGCNKHTAISQKNSPVDTTASGQKQSEEKFYIGEGEEYKTPYYIFRGEVDTPKIIIDGGIHGDEIAGYMACDTLVKYLKVEKGTVYVIPRLNRLACLAVKRGLKNDFNRSFPGDKNSRDFEYRLAYEFMHFIDSIRPAAVINHHEARNRYNEEAYRKNPDNAFGQVLITCLTPPEDLLKRALKTLNSLIENSEYDFNIQYYPIQPNHSLDNIVSKLHVKSYTVETYRGYALPDRINMHLKSDESFLKETGITYTLPSRN